MPHQEESSDYNIIKHCRRDRLRDVLRSLVFKRAFRTFVLANIEADNVTAMLILYRMT